MMLRLAVKAGLLCALLPADIQAEEVFDVYDPSNNSRTLAQTHLLRAEVEVKTALGAQLADAERSLSAAREHLDRWHEALASLRTAQSKWVEDYVATLNAYIQQSQAVVTEDDLRREQTLVMQLRNNLPTTEDLDGRGNAILTSLMDYIPRALSACAATAPLLRGDSQLFARRPDLAGRLQKAERVISASLDDARSAYGVVNAQMQSRGRLQIAVEQIWRKRRGAGAARIQVDEARDMGARLDRSLHDLEVVIAYRVELEVMQAYINRLKRYRPLSALRKQRMMAVLLRDVEQELQQHQLVAEIQPDAQQLLFDCRGNHEMSLDELLRVTPDDLAQRRIARVAWLRDQPLSDATPRKVCAELMRTVEMGSDLKSEEAFQEHWETCANHI